MTSHRITTAEELSEIYGEPAIAALKKELTALTPGYRAMIEASPFVALATSSPEDGIDCSPRGDPAGFVHIADERTIMLPDRPGNRRIDTLRNILVDPRIALLFLIPGLGETLRINGRAEISRDPEILARFEMNGRLPITVLVVHVEKVFFQCSKAIIRSKLWDPAMHVSRGSLPTAGKLLEEATQAEMLAAEYDPWLEERIKQTLY
ncbi:pyridoxamine 5'-phosphate oxidase family protein [Lutibaculum baratangense]|uniref:Phosphohydrolase (MutT/nudix family protein) n=1 Tax=Lutibaculum baratangense AMV1 TaxID=631454 RepID=V4RLP5_9HYPH|nr:pyridoxamine 5'-phosphate oxidase family protein [Lutibaculum baratangense]ESR26936.1 Phosphohydrolase (MutT/nudix family protein) [Lutibaculum baratangense AMV1]